MTEAEALSVLQKHRTEHNQKEPNALIVDEALKVALKCVNQAIRFHQLTDADDPEFTYEVGFLRKWVFEGKEDMNYDH